MSMPSMFIEVCIFQFSHPHQSVTLLLYPIPSILISVSFHFCPWPLFLALLKFLSLSSICFISLFISGASSFQKEFVRGKWQMWRMKMIFVPANEQISSPSSGWSEWIGSYRISKIHGLFLTDDKICKKIIPRFGFILRQDEHSLGAKIQNPNNF